MAVSHRGAISFGLLHIPVGLYTATQDNDIHFNQLCREDGSRVKYKKICASCGKEISSKDIVKGFEYDKDKFVIMTDEDFEKAKSEKDKTIHILHFTDLNALFNITLIREIRQKGFENFVDYFTYQKGRFKIILLKSASNFS